MYDKENNIELRKSTIDSEGRHLRETIWYGGEGNMYKVARRLYFSDEMLDEYSDNPDVSVYSYSQLFDGKTIRTKHIVEVNNKVVGVYNTTNIAEAR